MKISRIISQCPECRDVTMKEDKDEARPYIVPAVVLFKKNTPKILCYGCTKRLTLE